MADQKVDYGAVLKDLEVKKAEIDRAIVVIRGIMGMPVAVVGASTASPAPQSVPRDHGDHKGGIKPDTFFNMTVVAAAEKYLRMVHEPKSVKEIADALRSGGLEAKAATTSALIGRKAKVQEVFVYVNRKWGLIEWYPNNKK